jgi:hypothetical protein
MPFKPDHGTQAKPKRHSIYNLTVTTVQLSSGDNRTRSRMQASIVVTLSRC